MASKQYKSSTLENVKSRLLTDEENEMIFKSLGNRCQTLATTTAELHIASRGERNIWGKQTSGVVCFVKDWNKRTFFVRFYDEKDKSMVWEYDVVRTRGFYFNADDTCLAITAGENKVIFLDKNEAEDFKKVVMEKIDARKNRRKVIRASAGTGASIESESNATKSTSDKKKKKVTKMDISKPTNFKHVQQVGWNPNVGLNFNSLDPDMRSLFEKVGIKDQDKVDKETMQFIYDFVEQHGKPKVDAKGDKEVQRKRQVPPPQPPQRNPLPQGTKRYIPPPPPPSGRNRTGPPPPPPSNISKNARPPPPPSSTSKNARPPPPPSNINKTAIPPPPPSSMNKTGSALHQSDEQHSSQNPQQLPFQDSDAGATGDNPIKHQIMELLRDNPEEITDFLYNIIDKQGGINFIKDSLARQMAQTHSPQEDDQESDSTVTQTSDGDSGQVAGKSSSGSEVPGRTNADNVAGRRTAGEVPGTTVIPPLDYEVSSSDLFDEDDEEDWDDYNDTVDQK